MEYMATLPDKAFDLAIVDPPYTDRFRNMDYMGNMATAKTYKRDGLIGSKPQREYFDLLTRVSKNQIIFGFQYFISHLRNTNCIVIWDKEINGNFADAELAWTSFKSATRIFKFQWAGMLQGDMKNKELRIHPTQKPVKLYEWLLTNYAKPGQRIIDTHLGSGSSAIACNNLGFEMVGCELDTDYYKAACQRVEKATEQLRLFA